MDATKPGLPADVLDRDDLQRALREHDFAAAFTLVKKYGGWSQNRIAVACSLTPGKISNIINGRHHVTSYEVLCRITDGLRIPGLMMGLAPRPWEKQQEEATPADSGQTLLADQPTDVPWRADATLQLAAHLTRSDLMMDRRAATRALTTAAITGAPLLDSLEGWLQRPDTFTPPPRRRGRLGAREVEELEAIARAFRQWGHRLGGGLHRQAVIGQLSAVSDALEEHQAPPIEQRLYRVMAQLAGSAATMAWDSGMQRRAQEYYRLALHAAHAGEDIAFGTNILAGMARQMLYRDRAADAKDLVRLAQDGSRGIVSPRVEAMLRTREAWAYAAVGRTQAFRRATGQAADALASAAPDAEPYWIHYFNEAELAGVTGGRLLDLARREPRYADDAADHIRQALANRGPESGRSYALDNIGLAECLFIMGDVTGAVVQAHKAVDAASRTHSARVRSQLGELYPYTVGRDTSRGIREVRGRIRELLAT